MRASVNTVFLLILTSCSSTRLPDGVQQVEDGYDLWLRYRSITDERRLAEYRNASVYLVMDSSSPTLRVTRDELASGLAGLLGVELPIETGVSRDGAIVAGTPEESPLVATLPLSEALRAAGTTGYVLRAMRIDGRQTIVIAANHDVGVLYGAFALLRLMQMHRSLHGLDVTSAPRIQLRLLDHWDNLNRTVERGYAGASLWEWDALPDSVSPRYRDYARANASIGINGSVLTNVNANAQVLTPAYLAKVAALADVFRPYGITVYLTARFSAPLEIGGLGTADPLNLAVREWWANKAAEIYRFIPDFGGFLVKANSEGQPGPQDYGRSQVDGANMLADAVGPHGGIVMWRAFVYSDAVPADRVGQAYDEFKPLDGAFRKNVLVQVKNGPLDFQPREPFHPLFGAMPSTSLMIELQITKEYLGQDTHLAFLAPMWVEALGADTHAEGEGSTVGRVIDGSLDDHDLTGIAGVANTGTDRNWTGSHFNQANWFAYGRLAWDHTLSPGDIAEEWIRLTFSNDSEVVVTVKAMMLASREAVVNYMTPLGLAHQMAREHHYGPGPWVEGGRADWTSVYYNRADSGGIGFDRTTTGSNAVAQYFPPVRDRFAKRDSVPDNLLLWFHHVPWTAPMRSGRSLWAELVHRYNAGVDTVQWMNDMWSTIEARIDRQRFLDVQAYLRIQEKEAEWWRDASLLYFQTFSGMPIPAGDPQPAHPLSFYRGLRCPPDPRKPRCEAVY
jgi:alpha-glucuronidase